MSIELVTALKEVTPIRRCSSHIPKLPAFISPWVNIAPKALLYILRYKPEDWLKKVLPSLYLLFFDIKIPESFADIFNRRNIMIIHVILAVTLVHIAMVIYHINVIEKPESSSKNVDWKVSLSPFKNFRCCAIGFIIVNGISTMILFWVMFRAALMGILDEIPPPRQTVPFQTYRFSYK